MVDDLSLLIFFMSNRTNGMVYFQGGATEMECVITCSNTILTEEKSCCSRIPKGGISLGLLVNIDANCWLKTKIGLYAWLFSFDLSVRI